MRMHARLKAGRYPNCRKLADELEVSSKTVQRDLDFMRYRLGLPIEYDQLHFGFYYSEPVTNFPNIEISEGELVALYVGQKALTQYKGTSFEAPLSTAFRKITDGLRDTISMTWSDLDSAISFRTTGRTAAESTCLSSSVMRCSNRSRCGSTKKARRRGLRTTLCPTVSPRLHGKPLVPVRVRSGSRQGPDLRPAPDPQRSNRKTKFRRPLDFSIGKYLGESFGVFAKPAKIKQAIRIAFDAFAAPRIAERQWHPSQKIKQLRNGGLELSLTLGNLEEVERWILSWGTHAEARAPAELKERMAKTVSALAKTYDSAF